MTARWIVACAMSAVGAGANGMVIDPVDPAFGVAIVEIHSPLGAAAHTLRGLAALPGGGAALLVADGQPRADNSICTAARIVIIGTDGQVGASYTAASLGLPACIVPTSLGFGVADNGTYYIVANPDNAPSPAAPPRVWRASVQGVPDPGFAATFPANVETMLRPTVQVLPDGSVAVGGPAILSMQGQRVPALIAIRFRSSGSIDPDFGTQGLAFAIPTIRPIYQAEGGGMVVGADGSTFVAGNIFEDDAGAKIYTDATVARFDAHGRLDTTYGDAGFAIPLRDASTFAQSLAVMGGEAYLAGVQGRDTPFAFVARMKANGQVDQLFGNAGVAGTDRFRETSFEPQVAVDVAGRVYFAVSDARGHLRMHRFRSDGRPDTDYGVDGIAFVAASGWAVANYPRIATRANAVFIGAGTFFGSDDVRRFAIGAARLNDAGGHRADIAAGTSIVYYHAALDHYFMTANPAEQALLDSGTTQGWRRTGQEFRVVTSNAPDAELSPVCRYYGRPEAHLDSHFFSAATDECAAVAQKFGASWLLETNKAFQVQAADRTSGACPRGSEKVYRAFNGRADANHYYGVLPQAPGGWTYEGYGPAPLPTAFCAPLL